MPYYEQDLPEMGMYGPKPKKPWKKPLRTWEITLMDHSVEEHTGHFCFNNPGEGLLVRRYPKGEDKTIIVICYAPGSWLSYREIECNGE